MVVWYLIYNTQIEIVTSLLNKTQSQDIRGHLWVTWESPSGVLSCIDRKGSQGTMVINGDSYDNDDENYDYHD